MKTTWLRSRAALRLAHGPLLAAVAVAALSACIGGSSSGGGAGSGAPDDDFDRTALLTNIGTNVVLPTYEAFATSTAVLLDAAQAYEDAVKGVTGSPSTTLATLQVRWEEAIDIWQRAELLQIGPAGRPGATTAGVIGGQGLRDEIYSWPLVNPCRIDEELVAGNGDGSYLDGSSIPTFGLDALEYLIARATGAAPSDENACGAADSINQSGTWAALVANGDELAIRRAEYILEVAMRLHGDALELRDAWHPQSGDFLGAFAGAGEAGSPYPSAQRALNDVYFAMFYLDTELKDGKLATPAGISPPGASPDSDLVESRWLSRSKRHVIHNLEAFQELFLGNDPGDGERTGFDDFLAELGASALANTVANDVAEAIAAAAAIDEPGEDNGTLRAAVDDDADDTERLAHAEVKDVTDRLKAELRTTLNFAVPAQGAGDND